MANRPKNIKNSLRGPNEDREDTKGEKGGAPKGVSKVNKTAKRVEDYKN